MENVSKALVMAGGVLLGILVISFMMLILRSGASMNAEYDSQMSERQLLDFNSKFEVYGGAGQTFFNVMTVINLAFDENTKNGWTENNGVKVIIKKEDGSTMYTFLASPAIERNYIWGGDGSDTADKNKKYILGDIVKENTTTDDAGKYTYSFTGTIHYNTNTGKVNEVIFGRVENK